MPSLYPPSGTTPVTATHALPSRSSLRQLASALLASALLGAALAAPGAPTLNGFDLAGASIPVEVIERGGPPRDGIPAIDRPHFVSAADASFLEPADRVLGLVIEGETRAYPVAILNWHEIVNDRFGELAVAVTYCPLCGTGVAYRAESAGRRLEFGVSGLLYNSDVLLYDRQTESLWSQILSAAVSGPMRGERISMVPLEHTTWADWRKRFPSTQVLSTETGHHRDYGRDPYASYRASEGLMFGVAARDERYPAKTWVLGIERNGVARVYPFPELARVAGGVVEDELGGQRLRVIYDAASQSAHAEDAAARPLLSLTAFWFAWMAFHPGSDVFRAAGSPIQSGGKMR